MCDIEIDLVGDLWPFCSFNGLSHEQERGCHGQAQGNQDLLKVCHCEKFLHLAE